MDMISRRNRSRTGKYYKEITHPDHPLARNNGKIRLHRKLAYDKFGAGPQSCYWCKREIFWIPGKTTTNSVCVDHLDEDINNNSIENLELACVGCNSLRKRGWRRESDDLVIFMNNGPVRVKIMECHYCHAEFKRPLFRKIIGNVFCSKSCAGKNNKKVA